MIGAGRETSTQPYAGFGSLPFEKTALSCGQLRDAWSGGRVPRAAAYTAAGDCSPGRVAEWSIAPVLKTGNGQPFVGSNPTSSAKSRAGV